MCRAKGRAGAARSRARMRGRVRRVRCARGAGGAGDRKGRERCTTSRFPLQQGPVDTHTHTSRLPVCNHTGTPRARAPPRVPPDRCARTHVGNACVRVHLGPCVPARVHPRARWTCMHMLTPRLLVQPRPRLSEPSARPPHHCTDRRAGQDEYLYLPDWELRRKKNGTRPVPLNGSTRDPGLPKTPSKSDVATWLVWWYPPDSSAEPVGSGTEDCSFRGAPFLSAVPSASLPEAHSGDTESAGRPSISTVEPPARHSKSLDSRHLSLGLLHETGLQQK